MRFQNIISLCKYYCSIFCQRILIFTIFQVLIFEIAYDLKLKWICPATFSFGVAEKRECFYCISYEMKQHFLYFILINSRS